MAKKLDRFLCTEFWMNTDVSVENLETELQAEFPGAQVHVICERQVDPPYQRIVELRTPRILEVEDERRIGNFLRRFSERRGYGYRESMSSNWVFAEFPPTVH